MPVEDGVTVTAESIGALTEHDTRFTAVRTRRSDGKIHIASLEEIADQLRKSGKVRGQENLTVLGHPALEVRTEDGDKLGRLRTLKIKGTLYQLGVEYSRKTAPARIEADVAKFFESFSILEEVQE